VCEEAAAAGLQAAAAAGGLEAEDTSGAVVVATRSGVDLATPPPIRMFPNDTA
jgi:hypothetical protein